MSALKNISLYDAVPTHEKPISRRLYYVVGSDVCFMKDSYSAEMWIKSGTRVTEYKGKALISAGKVFVVQHGVPKGVNSNGNLIICEDAGVEIQDLI